MPQEKRKRGRRAVKKEKKEATPEPIPEIDNLYIDDTAGGFEGSDETTFFGLLTEEEQEYFKRADEILALDQFEEAEGMWIVVRHGGGTIRGG